MAEQRVTIYTDGGCEPNPGVGGWGAVLIYGGHRKEISGGDDQTTNNRMELTAALEAMRTLKRPCHIDLYTDSEYLRKGITEWMPGWKARGWRRKTGEILNSDLWKALDAEVARHTIAWRWVKGHSGVEENERCDILAEQEIRKRQHATQRSG